MKLQFSRTFVSISTDYGGGPQMVIRPARIYTICERRLAAAGWWLLVETTTFFPIKVLLIVTGLHIPPPGSPAQEVTKSEGGCAAAGLQCYQSVIVRLSYEQQPCSGSAITAVNTQLMLAHWTRHGVILLHPTSSVLHLD